MTCRRRKRTLAHSHTCVRANRTSVQLSQSADALQRGEDTTSCAIALFAWLDNTLHRANALFICRMQELEFNIIDIIGAIYAFSAYRRQTRRFDPPLRADRAGAFANDPSTHPRPPFRNQVLT
jgi:hypothetical protein